MRVIVGGSANGVDGCKRFNPDLPENQTRAKMREQYGIPAGAPVVGFVGRIVRDKGLVELADAWKSLRAEYPDLHWLVVGPFEAQDLVPDDVYHLLNHDPRIHLAGYVDHRAMPTIYAAIDVLAFPSHREGFGVVALEAAAMRVPVVATRIAGCVDAVQDGVTGTLVPVHDSDALADALRDYLCDPALRLRHGEAGRARVLAQFQPEKIWEALYQEYLAHAYKSG